MFYTFSPSLSSARPKLTSLIHEAFAKHCGGLQHQPTKCSIKYGGMAFKAMLNAPDIGRERGECAAFVRRGKTARSEKMLRVYFLL